MMKLFSILFSIILFTYVPLLAQKNNIDQIIVPLSTPLEGGIIVINHHKGAIKITGFEGDVIIVNASLRYKNITQPDHGLKQIRPNLIQLEAEEHDNEVTIRTNSLQKTIDLDIQVPNNFSVRIQKYDIGPVEVQNLRGEMDISNVDGDIIVSHISGSAVLNTVDGNIRAVFAEVTPNLPMAFTSVEGKIEIVLPAFTKAIARMKTDNGEIFTDFKMDIQPRQTKTEKDKQSDTFRIKLDDWIYGKINGGGPEFMIKSFNGSIYLRSRD